MQRFATATVSVYCISLGFGISVGYYAYQRMLHACMSVSIRALVFRFCVILFKACCMQGCHQCAIRHYMCAHVAPTGLGQKITDNFGEAKLLDDIIDHWDAGESSACLHTAMHAHPMQ